MKLVASNLEEKRFVIKTSRQKFDACEWIAAIVVDEDKPFSITVMSEEEKRNALQNSYLWGWVYKTIAQQLEDAGIVIPLDDGREVPYDTEMLHEIFKDQFLCYDTFVFRGKERKRCWSTTRLRKSGKDEDQDQSPDRAPTFGWYVKKVKQCVFQIWEIHVPPTFNEDWRSLESEMRKAA